MEAVYELFGGVATSLAASASVGDTTVSLNASLAVGTPFEIDVAGTPEYTSVQDISGSGPYAVTLPLALKYAHDSGAIVGTFQSPANIAGLTTVVRGELFDVLDEELPAMIITIPKVNEYRANGVSGIPGFAGKKGIDYQIRMMVGALMEGDGTNDQGALLIGQFYDMLDAIGTALRTLDAKTLITTSFPAGASIRFGEDSSWAEQHERQENTLRIIAMIDSISTELVDA